jgi:hypothetical protein
VLEYETLDKLAELPPALADLHDTSTPTRLAARQAVVDATVEALAEVWPKHESIIRGDAAASASK